MTVDTKLVFSVEEVPCDFGGTWYGVGYHDTEIFQYVAFFFEQDDAEAYAVQRNVRCNQHC